MKEEKCKLTTIHNPRAHRTSTGSRRTSSQLPPFADRSWFYSTTSTVTAFERGIRRSGCFSFSRRRIFIPVRPTCSTTGASPFNTSVSGQGRRYSSTLLSHYSINVLAALWHFANGREAGTSYSPGMAFLTTTTFDAKTLGALISGLMEDDTEASP